MRAWFDAAASRVRRAGRGCRAGGRGAARRAARDRPPVLALRAPVPALAGPHRPPHRPRRRDRDRGGLALQGPRRRGPRPARHRRPRVGRRAVRRGDGRGRGRQLRRRRPLDLDQRALPARPPGPLLRPSAAPAARLLRGPPPRRRPLAPDRRHPGDRVVRPLRGRGRAELCAARRVLRRRAVLAAVGPRAGRADRRPGLLRRRAADGEAAQARVAREAAPVGVDRGRGGGGPREHGPRPGLRARGDRGGALPRAEPRVVPRADDRDAAARGVRAARRADRARGRAARDGLRHVQALAGRAVARRAARLPRVPVEAVQPDPRA